MSELKPRPMKLIDANALKRKIEQTYLPSDSLTAGILYDLISTAPPINCNRRAQPDNKDTKRSLKESMNLDAERYELQKAFALACRFIADNMDCPANEVNAEFPACKHSADEKYQDDAPHGTCEDGGWLCWQDHILERVRTEPVCRVCGCTEDNACQGGCYWVEPELCSACAQAGEGSK